MIFRAGVKIALRAVHRRGHALVFFPQRPPRLVVIRRFHFAGKYLPAPLVHQQAEGQESNFVKRPSQQQRNIGRGRRHLLNQPDLLQIFRRDGKRNGVADGLMKTIVGTAAKKIRLLAVRKIVVEMAQFMVHDDEIV